MKEVFYWFLAGVGIGLGLIVAPMIWAWITSVL